MLLYSGEVSIKEFVVLVDKYLVCGLQSEVFIQFQDPEQVLVSLLQGRLLGKCKDALHLVCSVSLCPSKSHRHDSTDAERAGHHVFILALCGDEEIVQLLGEVPIWLGDRLDRCLMDHLCGRHLDW